MITIKSKQIARIYLILAPCLFLMIVIGSCNGFRVWLIAADCIKLGGYTEREALYETRDEFLSPTELKEARKDIKKVFTKYWADDEKGEEELRKVFKKYQIYWSDSFHNMD